MLKDTAWNCYLEGNYNCAETVIRAANSYYDLDLHNRDMIMMGGYGGGIQTGDACGTLLAAVAVLSVKYVEQRAHESEDIGPVVQLLIERFRQELGSIYCRDIRPVQFREDVRCWSTIEKACSVLESVLADYPSMARAEADT